MAVHSSTCLLVLLLLVSFEQSSFGWQLSETAFKDRSSSVEGDKTQWHGFDRFDFLMDAKTLKIVPTNALDEEGTGISRQIDGQLRGVVIVPKQLREGKPWSWRGRYFDHEPQVEIELLRRGFHVAFIQSDEMKHWDAWFSFLTHEHDLSEKPGFVGMSGGGRNAFNWATRYPDRVSCIYADNPLITRESLMKLDELVRRDVPLLHICGSLDPLSVNHTFPIESIYQQLGGRISVMIKDGVGHHPHRLRDPTVIADFIADSLTSPPSAPAFVGSDYAQSSFFGVVNQYLEFPAEDMHIALRGSLFSDTFVCYEFKPDCTSGNVHVIVPKMAAPGKPWVMRADPALRDAVIDLALLQKGFHIVRAPRPRDTAATQMQEWRAFYEHLVEHGFSKKPVMEGAGGAASEIYEWAIANPDKASCIYGENPILRHYSSRSQPIDSLTPLANAGVPILHVCGSDDPWLESQTRVAEQRYRELNGTMTVVIQSGQDHFPLAPRDIGPVVEFIIESVAARDRE